MEAESERERKSYYATIMHRFSILAIVFLLAQSLCLFCSRYFLSSSLPSLFITRCGWCYVMKAWFTLNANMYMVVGVRETTAVV